MNFNVGDKVKSYGVVGIVKEVKFGGYLVEWGAHEEDPKHNGTTFAYESELTLVEDDQ